MWHKLGIHHERFPAGPTRSHEVISGTVVEIAALLSNTSVWTLILGIDQSGRIVQHDRNAPEVLEHGSESLAGTPLSDLVVGPTGPGSPLDGLLEAARAGREATAVLAVRVRRTGTLDAVTSVQPMQGEHTALTALVILRMPPPGDERFVDPALMRHALLDDTFRRIGATLDLDQMARGLIGILVPHFCNAAGLLVLGCWCWKAWRRSTITPFTPRTG